MPPARKRTAAKAKPVLPPAEPLATVNAEEAPAERQPPARGMTTEQIRRVGNRIAEHEKDLKNSTSRR
jgi:hypothetical protein